MKMQESPSYEQGLKIGRIPQRKDILGFFGRVMVVFESVFFPLMFLLFAAATVSYFFRPYEVPVLGQDTPFGVGSLFFALLSSPGTVAPDTSALQAYVMFGTEVVRPLLVLFFQVMCAMFIALRTNIRYKPTTLREIGIPLLGTFIMMLLPLSTHVGWFGHPFTFPDVWMLPMLALGTGLGLAGGVFTIYALIYLRRNFSIFVEVREVVLAGPYRYVRHPMYLGEIVMIAGMVLTMLSLFSIGLIVSFILFQYLRARMEQSRLAAASPEYAEHMKTSGMFFPRSA